MECKECGQTLTTDEFYDCPYCKEDKPLDYKLPEKKEMDKITEEIKREKKEWYKKGFAKQNKGRIRKW